MRTGIAVLFLALTSCGYSLKAQVVLEPADEASALSIGKAETGINTQPKEVARESTISPANRALFAPGREPY